MGILSKTIRWHSFGLYFLAYAELFLIKLKTVRCLHCIIMDKAVKFHYLFVKSRRSNVTSGPACLYATSSKQSSYQDRQLPWYIAAI